MIAHEVKKLGKGKGSFAGLAQYLTSDQGKRERVGEVRLTNCVSTDLAGALLEIRNTEQRNTRAKSEKTYHLVFSFPPAEDPGADVLRVLEERLMAELGLADHQRLSVVHRDTDNLHVHVAINRIHPTTHNLVSPGFSKLKLVRACGRLEEEFGLTRVNSKAVVRDRGRERLLGHLRGEAKAALLGVTTWEQLFEELKKQGATLRVKGQGMSFGAEEGSGVWVKASSVDRELSKAALEKRLGPFPKLPIASSVDSHPDVPKSERTTELAVSKTPIASSAESRPGVLKFERMTGLESAAGWLQRECANTFLAATSWADLHRLAGIKGVRAQARGAGLVFVVGEGKGIGVKASSVDRELSKAALEKRLGPFTPSPAAAKVRAEGYQRQPIDSSAAEVWGRYQAQRATQGKARDGAMASAHARRDAAKRALQASVRTQWQARKLFSRGRGGQVWAQAIKMSATLEYRAIAVRFAADTRAALNKGRPVGWNEWLQREATRGDDACLQALRRRKQAVAAGNAVGGERVADVRDEPDLVTPGGVKVYSLPDGRCRDDGQRLRLDAGSSLAGAAEFLRIAQKRYGKRLRVEGDEKFLRHLGEAAAVEGMRIEFVDKTAEAARLSFLKEIKNERRRRDGAGATVPGGRKRGNGSQAERGQRGRGAGRGGSQGGDELHPAVLRSRRGGHTEDSLRSLQQSPLARVGKVFEGVLSVDAHVRLRQHGQGTEPSEGLRRGVNPSDDKGINRGR